MVLHSLASSDELRFDCAHVDLCLTECLYYGALDTVKKLCYGKQRCLFIINDQQFRNPCTPETKKYLTVIYSCGMDLINIW